jgi:hypothetical protein
MYIGRGYSDATGTATITIEGPLPPGADITVTVTGYNFVPYVGTVAVIGSTPDIEVTLTPYGVPIQIPAAGGSFEYNVAVTNNETSTQIFHFWMDVVLPGGTTLGPLLGPIAGTLDGGVSIDRDRIQNVPGSAPEGTYMYNAYVGVYGVSEWSADYFTFEKLTGDAGSEVNNWANDGEGFDVWDIDDTPDSRVPEAFSFTGNYPNPFNPVTTFSYQLSAYSYVKLEVFDLNGRRVSTLVDGWRSTGHHEATFDASDLASGIYLYRLQAAGEVVSGKMAFVK